MKAGHDTQGSKHVKYRGSKLTTGTFNQKTILTT